MNLVLIHPSGVRDEQEPERIKDNRHWRVWQNAKIGRYGLVGSFQKGRIHPENAASEDRGGVRGNYPRTEPAPPAHRHAYGLVRLALSDSDSGFVNRGWQQYTFVPIEQE
jgi:hypothetical protein